MPRIGVIGGSGLYKIEGLEVLETVNMKTPFGEPSHHLTVSRYAGKEIVFLPRHGEHHTILPTELNYRANIYAMKKLGVERIISLSACGSFKEDLKPCDLVVVDQFFDRTNQGRQTTFFGQGIVAHVSFAEPVCRELAGLIYKAAKSCGFDAHMGGTYLNMEGPAFSTRAESKVYKSWGMDVIGMTNMPEARLAREAEICYSTVAFVTDYDAWREGEEHVTIEMIVSNFTKNVENAKKLLKTIIPDISHDRHCGCKDALKYAIMTKHHAIPAAAKKKLGIIIEKYVK